MGIQTFYFRSSLVEHDAWLDEEGFACLSEQGLGLLCVNINHPGLFLASDKEEGILGGMESWHFANELFVFVHTLVGRGDWFDLGQPFADLVDGFVLEHRDQEAVWSILEAASKEFICEEDAFCSVDCDFISSRVERASD
jgi:hypothetical protein